MKQLYLQSNTIIDVNSTFGLVGFKQLAMLVDVNPSVHSIEQVRRNTGTKVKSFRKWCKHRIRHIEQLCSYADNNVELLVPRKFMCVTINTF